MGVFPAGSIAWRLSKEKWMKSVKFISELKLRASYGLAGNNRYSDDLWHNIYRVYSGSSAPGSIMKNIITISLPTRLICMIRI